MLNHLACVYVEIRAIPFTGLLGQLFSKSDKGTILCIDEASVFLEDERLANFILRILRMALYKRSCHQVP